VILKIDKADPKPAGEVLRVDELQVLDDRRHMVVDGVNLIVRAGEILGIAGVQGNGQTELAEALTGLRPAMGGKVDILGHETTHANPRQVTEAGTAHVPEDRHKHGLLLTFSVSDNLNLNTYYLEPFAHGIEQDDKVIEDRARDLVKVFDVRTPSIETPVKSLSGGNQQKVIIARELSRPVALLIASQPTRGLDVGSIEFIHHRIVEARDKGAAVLLISAELDEIMSLSDRIAVIYKGRILKTLDAKTATREEIGLLMAGVTQEEAHV
jgi:simple sugar transport system ATP-binding protein